MSKTRSTQQKSKHNQKHYFPIYEVPIKKRDKYHPETRGAMKPLELRLSSNLKKEKKYIRELQKYILILEDAIKYDYDKYQIGIGNLEDNKKLCKERYDKLNARHKDMIMENKKLKKDNVKKQNKIEKLTSKLTFMISQNIEISNNFNSKEADSIAEIDNLNRQVKHLSNERISFFKSVEKLKKENEKIKKENQLQASQLASKEFFKGLPSINRKK